MLLLCLASDALRRILCDRCAKRGRSQGLSFASVAPCATDAPLERKCRCLKDVIVSPLVTCVTWTDVRGDGTQSPVRTIVPPVALVGPVPSAAPA